MKKSKVVVKAKKQASAKKTAQKKTALWESGVKALAAKKQVNKRIKQLDSKGYLSVTKTEIITFAKRAGLHNWKEVINTIYGPKVRKDALESFMIRGQFSTNKKELRKFAKLLM